MNARTLIAAAALCLPLALPAPARAAVFCDGRVVTEDVIARQTGQVTRYEVFAQNLTGQALRLTVTVRVPWSLPNLQPTPTTQMVSGGDRYPFVFAAARNPGARVPTTTEVAQTLILNCAGR